MVFALLEDVNPVPKEITTKEKKSDELKVRNNLLTPLHTLLTPLNNLLTHVNNLLTPLLGGRCEGTGELSKGVEHKLVPPCPS